MSIINKDAVLRLFTDLNNNISGNAATATKLATARTINGVSFDGSANITLPLASTSVSGTVQLNDTLTSTATTHALTAAQGKVLNDSKLGKTENAVSATKLKTSRTISLTGGVTGSVSFDGSANATIATTVTGLGEANGIATLDSSGQIPSNQLPSYVDDVLEYLNVAAFPTIGQTGKIYVETTGNTTYRWSGSVYVKIASGEVSSVAGKTGVVTLTKSDVGLSNVDNTTDSAKNVATAAKLATARTIGGISFDGTANINLPGVNTAGNQSTSGNAATATSLQTARTINGTSFNGTANITTANWGAACTLTVGRTGKSVNGSANVAWTADEILPTGTNGQVLKHNGTSWVAGTDTDSAYSAMTVEEATAGTSTTASLISPSVLKSAISTYSSEQATITGNAASATKLQTARTIGGVSFDGTANINLPGVNTAGNQNTSGNAGSATKLATACTLTVGRTGKTFDGTANVAWTATEILPTATSGQFLKFDGTNWIAAADNNTTYSAMSQAEADTGTATSSRAITAAVLKQAIQTHAPTGTSGGMNFAAKIEIELEVVFNFAARNYQTSRNILSVSNQANIASAVIDSNGILCLTFNTPISNPYIISTTKSEVKVVRYDEADYKYLTSSQPSGFMSMSDNSTFSIFQDAEKGYVNTNTTLYISRNLKITQSFVEGTNKPTGAYTISSTFPAQFNLGIIDA